MAICCIACSESGFSEIQTAAGFPLNIVSVKASAIYCDMFDSEYSENSATYLFFTFTDGINGIKMKVTIE